MTSDDVLRKTELIRQLAAELGIKLQGMPKNKNGQGRFMTPTLQALAGTAKDFDSIMKGAPRDEYFRAADNLVEDYIKINTNRTGKSEKGGFRSQYKNVIKCGQMAESILKNLQARVEYWKQYANTPMTNETEEQRRYRIALADRFTTRRDPKKKNQRGRPYREIGSVVIKESDGGTDELSTVSEMARLFRDHCDIILNDEVLDAILDNGGRIESVARPLSPRFRELVPRCSDMLESLDTSEHERGLLQKALSALRETRA